MNSAALLIVLMAILFIYFWINFDELKSEQANRQMWYLNQKYRTGD